LRLAKQQFDQGNYQAARATLDTKEISQEQSALLAKQQHLQDEQTEITAQLQSNAAEFLFKARLTAINYALPNRIAGFTLQINTENYTERAVLSSYKTGFKSFLLHCLLICLFRFSSALDASCSGDNSSPASSIIFCASLNSSSIKSTLTRL